MENKCYDSRCLICNHYYLLLTALLKRIPATKIKHFICRCFFRRRCRCRLPFLLIAISFCFMAISFFSSAFDIPFVFIAPVDGSHSLFDRMNERQKNETTFQLHVASNQRSTHTFVLIRTIFQFFLFRNFVSTTTKTTTTTTMMRLTFNVR